MKVLFLDVAHQHTHRCSPQKNRTQEANAVHKRLFSHSGDAFRAKEQEVSRQRDELDSYTCKKALSTLTSALDWWCAIQPLSYSVRKVVQLITTDPLTRTYVHPTLAAGWQRYRLLTDTPTGLPTTLGACC